MDSSEKIVIGIFNFREVLRPFLESGRSAPFPGASRMIREVSHVWYQKNSCDLLVKSFKCNNYEVFKTFKDF